jgi:hypothetical protein
MSVSLLQTISAFLDEHDLLDGYIRKYFRFTSADFSSAPLLVIRKAGHGEISSVIQNIDISIVIVCNAAGQVAGSNRLNAIERLVRSVSKPASVVSLKVIASHSDPLPMENDMFYMSMILRATMENY